MNDLTPEQRKRVANAAMGYPHLLLEDWRAQHPETRENRHPEPFSSVWHPEIYNNQWKALVTWLAKQDKQSRYSLSEVIINAVAKHGTDTLELLALEILEAQDGE